MRSISRKFACALAVACLVAVSAGNAPAEILRMEAVGSEPIYPDGRAKRAPRDGAVQRAILEAVGRVASDYLLDQSGDLGLGPGSGGAPDPSESRDYAKIFGRDLVQYTSQYRILEDRGAGPALFAAEPGIESEYVVIVEVHVDAERVRSRLEEVGLLAPEAPELDTRRIVLEVLGLRVYPAYEALQTVLLEQIGASRVVPLEFSQDRIRLGVEYARGGPAELLDDLYARAPRELEITPVLSDELRLTISVVWADAEGEGGAGFSPRSSREFQPFAPGRNRSVVDSRSERQPPAAGRAGSRTAR